MMTNYKKNKQFYNVKEVNVKEPYYEITITTDIGDEDYVMTKSKCSSRDFHNYTIICLYYLNKYALHERGFLDRILNFENLNLENDIEVSMSNACIEDWIIIPFSDKLGTYAHTLSGIEVKKISDDKIEEVEILKRYDITREQDVAMLENYEI